MAVTLEQAVAKIALLEAQVTELNGRLTRVERKGESGIPINHHRACLAIPTFVKTGYTDWRLTFRRTVGGVTQEFLKILEWAEKADEDDVDDIGYNAQNFTTTFEDADTRLYDLIVSKTEGEARTCLRTITEGRGLLAWKKLYRQFGEATVQEHGIQMARLMKPRNPKSVKELGHAVEEWTADVMRLNRESKDHVISDAAMRVILAEELCANVPALREHLRIRREEYPSFEKMKLYVMDYARNSRVDPNAMDCSQVDADSKGFDEAPADWWNQDVNYMGKAGSWMWWNTQKGKGVKGEKGDKGKGKGKGKQQEFTGTCFNCGKSGHRSAQCPLGPMCHTCGQHGHKAASCPKGKGKSAGMAWWSAGGKGKGVQNLEENGTSGPEMGTTSSQWGLEGDWDGVVDLGSIETDKVEDSTSDYTTITGPESSLHDNMSMPDEEDWVTISRKKHSKKSKGKCIFKCGGACAGHLGSLDIVESEPVNKGIMNIGAGKWEPISKGITIDSGAAESVIPPDHAPQFPTVPSDASRAGVSYVAANGGKLPNKGEQKVMFSTKEGITRSMMFQVAPVNKPLGSVSRIVHQGNRVVFDVDESFIEHKATGQRMKLEERNGVFILDAWVPTFGRPGR